MNVIFGTVASAQAKSILAPCFIKPLNSQLLPGRKPGTSAKVTIGILNALQKRIKRDDFRDASISRHPARFKGWLPTTPITLPSTSPNPIMIFRA